MNGIMDFTEISKETNNLLNQIVRTHNISSPKFLDDHFNSVFLAKHKKYKEVIIRLASESYRKDFGSIVSPEICGYFDKNKHKKEEELLSIAKKSGMPTPTIIDQGLTNSIAWCIETKIPGRSMESVLLDLNQSAKTKILTQTGKLLAALHVEQSHMDKSMIDKYWNKRIGAILNNLLDLKVFSQNQIKVVEKAVSILKDKMLEVNGGLVGAVHMEIIPKHIFINSDYKITGIIDWETGEIEGDTLCDIVSTAYWLSGKGKYSNRSIILNNPDELDTVLKGYNSIIQIDKDTVIESLPFYDLMWLLNILWVKTFQGKTTFIDSRKRLVKQIVKSYSK